MSRSTDKVLVLIRAIAIAVMAGVYAASSADGQKTGYYGLGEEASAAQIGGWDIDVRPDGLGLPPGQGTVEQGDALFQEQCAQCHGVFGEGAGRWPVLVGGEGTLTEDRPEKTIGSYWPYATTLWDYIHRAMPFFNPQSLSNDEVYALTAYLLNMNDIVDDDFVADRHNLAAVEMPNRNGFYRDPRPDVAFERCMQNCRDPDSIQITWDASDLGVTPVDHLQNRASGVTPTAESVSGASASASAKNVYDQACAACHASGVAGAPKVGDKSAWLDRLGQGMQVLVDHALNGYHGKSGYMPAKGGQMQLSDDEVIGAVEYMVVQSRTKDEQL